VNYISITKRRLDEHHYHQLTKTKMINKWNTSITLLKKMNIMITCWIGRRQSTHALHQWHEGMNFQISQPKDDHHISFEPKNKKCLNFLVNDTKEVRILEQNKNQVCAHRLPTSLCTCKRLDFMKSSNIHNSQSYNIIFWKILATHT
jgi:hypothetical protein